MRLLLQLGSLFLPDRHAGLFGGSEPLWVSLAAIVSAIAAVATFWLAFITKGLARATSHLAQRTADMAESSARVAVETRDLVVRSDEQQLQVERHHQESLAPLLVMEADCLQSGTRPNHVRLQGYLRNIGGGPTRGSWVYIHAPLASAAQFTVRPIAAGDTWELDVDWTPVGHVQAEPYPYTVFISFTTVFGTRGAIEYESHSGLRDDLMVKNFIRPASDSESEVMQLEQRYRTMNPVLAHGTVGPR